MRATRSERAHLGRLGDADREEVRLDQQDPAPWREAGGEVSDRRFDVRDVMQHRPGGHEIEAAWIDRAGDDVALSQLKPGDCTSTSERSRSRATTRPRGPTRSASHAEIEPLPQPTSSAQRPDPRRATRCTGGASGRAVATSTPAASAHPRGDDPGRTCPCGRSYHSKRHRADRRIDRTRECADLHSWRARAAVPGRGAPLGRRRPVNHDVQRGRLGGHSVASRSTATRGPCRRLACAPTHPHPPEVRGRFSLPE